MTRTPRPEPSPETTTTTGTSGAPEKQGATDRVLNTIEKVGNKLPEPFTLFLLLFLITAVISTVMAWSGAQVQVPGSDEVRPIHGFFTKEAWPGSP